eukprot:TRINITY_DN5728_c0_g1_i1.p1 TRINITY_DN5728_c0_g1~~TRINITY_DN5728_c0_g1_i1.p1  ORF type:complete len:420 (+),score=83.44 TRINITY_DN5728_c0_g1_i1:72-1331(+)
MAAVLNRAWLVEDILKEDRTEVKTERRRIQLIQILRPPAHSEDIAEVQLSDKYNFIDGILSPKACKNLTIGSTLHQLRGGIIEISDYHFSITDTNLIIYIGDGKHIGSEGSYAFGVPTPVLSHSPIRSLLHSDNPEEELQPSVQMLLDIAQSSHPSILDFNHCQNIHKDSVPYVDCVISSSQEALLSKLDGWEASSGDPDFTSQDLPSLNTTHLQSNISQIPDLYQSLGQTPLEIGDETEIENKSNVPKENSFVCLAQEMNNSQEGVEVILEPPTTFSPPPIFSSTLKPDQVTSSNNSDRTKKNKAIVEFQDPNELLSPLSQGEGRGIITERELLAEPSQTKKEMEQLYTQVESPVRGMKRKLEDKTEKKVWGGNNTKVWDAGVSKNELLGDFWSWLDPIHLQLKRRKRLESLQHMNEK